MALSDRIHTSWQLLQSSLRVLRDNPRLLLFPIVSTLCTIALAIFFFAPVIVVLFSVGGGLGFTAEGWKQAEPQHLSDLMHRSFYIYGGLIYLVSLFAATFFNVAFYHEVMRALSGEPVSLGDGLRFALSRIRSILMWSLLAGTVGLIIRSIEERLGFIGRIVMAFIGTAWSVAAVFAIPVIVRRNETNPLAVLRDSVGTLKQTWGESLTGFVGIRLAGAAVVLVTLGTAAVGAIIAVLVHQIWFAVAVGVLWVLTIVAVAGLVRIATHIYRCALYVYASEGVVPGPYTPELMDAGWKVKKS